jgi:hypothetical protein
MIVEIEPEHEPVVRANRPRICCTIDAAPPTKVLLVARCTFDFAREH